MRLVEHKIPRLTIGHSYLLVPTHVNYYYHNKAPFTFGDSNALNKVGYN